MIFIWNHLKDINRSAIIAVLPINNTHVKGGLQLNKFKRIELKYLYEKLWITVKLSH